MLTSNSVSTLVLDETLVSDFWLRLKSEQNLMSAILLHAQLLLAAAFVCHLDVFSEKLLTQQKLANVFFYVIVNCKVRVMNCCIVPYKM